MPTSEPHLEFLEPPKEAGELGRLGPYRVISLLGKGGMGQVFRAQDSRLKRTVALKVMNKKFAGTPYSRKRFIEEARSMAAVHHDNVATIFEVGERAGTPFMAMEILKGKTLAALSSAGKKFTDSEVIEFAAQVSRGLAAAHECGIIHRDIKPANLWIEEPSGRAKILDFGLALATAGIDSFSGRGSVIGTPGYLAPEQARNEPVDDRTDLYSLGVVLYEMCAGTLPLTSRSIPGQLITIICHQPKPLREVNPDVPQPLADLIHRLLSKEPRDRPRSAAALEQELVSVAEQCQSESHAALSIVTDVSSPATDVNKKSRAEALAERHTIKTLLPWLISAAALLITVPLFIYWSGRPDVIVNEPVRPAPILRPKLEPVKPSSLKPLELKEVIAGSSRVVSGEAARFKIRLNNNARDGLTDPRNVNAKARVVAQVVTYFKQGQGTKRNAPAFPRKLSPRELPGPGETKELEIHFLTSGIPPASSRVIFELQAPDGVLISSADTELTIEENLGEGDMLGFETLRTHAGRGADTYVREGSDEDFGGSEFVHVLRKGGGSGQQEHIYLRFDMTKCVVPQDRIDRAVLLLTVAAGGLPSTSTINAYGVTQGIADDWAETGQSHLAWANAPTRDGVKSLKYLGQVTMDNSGDRLKDGVDRVRIYGPNLDDFIKSAPREVVTIVLIRENVNDRPTRFSSKEGKPTQAPALAVRRQS